MPPLSYIITVLMLAGAITLSLKSTMSYAVFVWLPVLAIAAAVLALVGLIRTGRALRVPYAVLAIIVLPLFAIPAAIYLQVTYNGLSDWRYTLYRQVPDITAAALCVSAFTIWVMFLVREKRLTLRFLWSVPALSTFLMSVYLVRSVIYRRLPMIGSSDIDTLFMNLKLTADFIARQLLGIPFKIPMPPLTDTALAFSGVILASVIAALPLGTLAIALRHRLEAWIAVVLVLNLVMIAVARNAQTIVGRPNDYTIYIGLFLMWFWPVIPLLAALAFNRMATLLNAAAKQEQPETAPPP